MALTVMAFAPSITFYERGMFGPSGALEMAKGRKSLRKTVAAGNAGNARGVKPMGGDDLKSSSSQQKTTNWVKVQGISGLKELPQEENVVQLVETKAKALMNAATNPNGAVSVVNYEGRTYCFDSSCSSCKIPLTKAKVLPANDETDNVDPRLSCDFCKATFNVRTGERVEDSGSAGLVGGIVKGLFSAQDKVPLTTYDLGEKNGEVLINLP
eukprot:CAMPEP_0184859198 /NCGR_PEP_ID=MMETSP0580-20130426/4205_1 /TAXON_ID=1118495 /ORGANISM="Dactyliosolen fragilissimus" /LENGTH=211 /DNA_ID=CAMNT_0027355687 /DNA_START=77 /DNA_END=712 /DNA_ORIENTATION=+